MIYTKHICKCTDAELMDFEWLASSAQCTPRIQLERIRFIGFAYEGDELISCRALKKPYLSYKERIFTLADMEDVGDMFYYESGYSYTVPRFRKMGLSKMLLSMLIRRAPHNVYATTHMDNVSAVRTMMAVGGWVMGRPYLNDDTIILLWGLKYA